METMTAPSMTALSIQHTSIHGDGYAAPAPKTTKHDPFDDFKLDIKPVLQVIHKTPAAPIILTLSAVHRKLDDGIRCPVCGHLYGDAKGFNDPCPHLIAHFGPCGWETLPPNAEEGPKAFRVFAALTGMGNPVYKVESGIEDVDWIAWAKPEAQTQALPCVA